MMNRHMSHVTYSTIHHSKHKCAHFSSEWCILWGMGHVQCEIVKLSCNKTKGNSNMASHGDNHGLIYTYTSLHQRIISFIKVSGLFSVRCCCWHKMARFYLERHFHNRHWYGLSPVGFRKCNTVLNRVPFTLWMTSWCYSIPPPAALDTTIILYSV